MNSRSDSEAEYNRSSRNFNEKMERNNVYRSLRRDRPLAQPRRHRHAAVITHNNEDRNRMQGQQQQQQQQQRLLAEAKTTTTTTYGRNSANPPETAASKDSSTSASTPSTTKPQQTSAMRFDRSLDRRSVTSSPNSERSSPSFLPSIDEGSSDLNAHRTSRRSYMQRLNDSHGSGSGTSNQHPLMSALASHIPPLATVSDNSSVDSPLDPMSILSTDSSDSSLEDDYENDYGHDNENDNDISASFRSTQSMPPAPAMNPFGPSNPKSYSTGNARRRPISPMRTHQSISVKQQQQQQQQSPYIRPSVGSYASLPNIPNLPMSLEKFDAESMQRASRRRSLRSSSTSSTAESDTLKKMNRRQCMANFLFSGVCLQLILLSVIALLVLWSRSQAALATDTLLRLRETESVSLLKLHMLESHSMHVHELMRNRILRENTRVDDFQDLLQDGEDPDEANNNNNDPLRDQYRQLSQMAADLRNHAAVKTLQGTIQETAIDKMTHIYGEGPVKVVIELDFGDGDNRNPPFIAHKTENRKKNNNNSNNNRQARNTQQMAKGSYISIVLWPDTPHAAWTWLEQIGRSVWDGSSIGWDPSSTLLQFQPTKDDPLDRGHIEFVEEHPRQEDSNPDMHHGAWTIGLRETLSSGNGAGDDESSSSSSNPNRLEMFINLSNNREQRKHETCVGKIFDGFDALQRLLERTELTEDGDARTKVRVKSVSAMHMTHKEFAYIYR